VLEIKNTLALVEAEVQNLIIHIHDAKRPRIYTATTNDTNNINNQTSVS